jgi:uroporphyrinogen-III synthase
VTEQGLAGQKILVTRPLKQSKILAGLIETAGGEAIVLPVIDIEAVDPALWNQQSLNAYDWLIFVSRNAVDCFVAGWQRPLPEALQLAAVGDGTAAAMRDQGLKVDLQPARSTGSEGLLATDAMQQLANQQVLIVRGVGGRELLADTLAARGANISYLEVYRRALTAPDTAALATALTADKVICTSVAGVNNLYQLFGPDMTILMKKPLVVLSERIRQHALSLGFERVFVTAAAGDKAILQRLTEMDG